jgi:hypothetical protein
MKEPYIKPEIRLEKLEPEALANPGSGGGGDPPPGPVADGCHKGC